MTVELSGDRIKVDDTLIDLSMEYAPGQRSVQATFDSDEDGEGGETITVQVKPKPAGFRLITRGASHDLRVLPTRVAKHQSHMIEKIPPDMSKYLVCPMPGLLVSLHVGEGDKVEAGQPLATVEAMKMENILRAEKSGTVKSVEAAEGDSLAVDAIILELE